MSNKDYANRKKVAMIILVHMKKVLKRHPLGAAAVSYFCTLIITRSLLFIVDNTPLPNTVFDIHNTHIHHFVLGIMLMTYLGFSHTFRKISKERAAVIFGMALALIVDEFVLWIKLADIYWSDTNLAAMVVIGFGLIVLTILSRKRTYMLPAQLPAVSVVIPAFNEERRLAKALRSIQKQTYKGAIEVIVVDNNSTDKTIAVAKKFGARVISETRRGVAYCRQSGFKAASGDLIASTDADTIVPKDWLKRFVDEFSRKQHAVAISGMYTFYDGSVPLRALTALFNYPLFCIFRWYSGANMIVRREAFFSIGGFNESINLSEDSDLCVRLAKIGKVYRLPFSKVQTSARRFNQLGLIGGLWDYSYTYAKVKLTQNKASVTFRSASEVPRLGWKPKFALNFAVFAVIVVLVGISPARAEVLEQKRRVHLPKPPHVVAQLHRATSNVVRHVK